MIRPRWDTWLFRDVSAFFRHRVSKFFSCVIFTKKAISTSQPISKDSRVCYSFASNLFLGRWQKSNQSIYILVCWFAMIIFFIRRDPRRCWGRITSVASSWNFKELDLRHKRNIALRFIEIQRVISETFRRREKKESKNSFSSNVNFNISTSYLLHISTHRSSLQRTWVTFQISGRNIN